ncbi:DUF460 domain-containing protein [Candidatus Micrarchaeota archaeon]|nr:DUF460 domain-containing protein [Candidatus Micrarchaeota archaeon]
MRLLAGIDPGTTFGLCLFDLKGNLVYLESIKNVGKEEIIKEMINRGKIIAIASDKTPLPETVYKIGALMNVRCYTPPKSMLQDEKTKITKPYSPKDLHQRDACAAAIGLYRKFENKFRHIDSLDLDEEKKEEIKEFFIRGHRINELIKPSEKTDFEKSKRAMGKKKAEYVKYLENIVHRYEEEIKHLKYDIKKIQEENKKKSDEIYILSKKIQTESYKDPEIRALRHEINRLKSFNKKLKNEGKRSNNKKITKKPLEKDEKSEKSDLKNLLSKVIDDYRSSRKKGR